MAETKKKTPTVDDVSKELANYKAVNQKAKLNIYDQVKNLNDLGKISTQITDNLADKIHDDLKDTAKAQVELKSAQELSLAMIKNVIKTRYPNQYPKFANMTWDEYSKQLLNNPNFISLDGSSNNSATAITLTNEGASVQISPQMYFKNMTTILNDVSIGQNEFELNVFNAFDFYNDGYLTSGISKLYTMEYTATGVITLDQNQIAPWQAYNVNGATVEGQTQNIAGYQASHPVFANVAYDDAGNGIGWGLFTRGNTAINVWKLSVTSPKQYAEMNRLFLQLMENSKRMAIWAITTYNLLNNINNIVLDNTNTNIRDCFNYALFPNLVRMSTPTQMFNLGDQVSITYTPAGASATSTANYSFGTFTDADLDSATSAVRIGTLSSNYLIQGYNTTPRINSCPLSDVHIVVTPDLYVKMYSGMLSVLYNYGLQSWNYYIPKENVHLLYKKPTIASSSLNPTQGLSAHLIAVSMEDEWFSGENILVLTKPKDRNMWPATYGYVWDDIQSNQWGAAMVQTDYMHFLIYGGVTPYAQAWWYHAKGLLNPLANSVNATTQNIVYNAGQPVTFNNANN